MSIMDVLIKILLISTLGLQIILLIYLFYTNHKRYQADKKFWSNLNEEIELSKQKIQKYLDEHPEEVIEDEQQDQDLQ